MGQRLGGSCWGVTGVSEGGEHIWGDLSVMLRNRGIGGDAGGFGFVINDSIILAFAHLCIRFCMLLLITSILIWYNL